MTVAVIIPTVPGREHDLDRCVAAYRRTAPAATLHVEEGHASCGEAWIAGAGKLKPRDFDYLHLTADDLEPHDGWLEAAVAAVDSGVIPAPIVYRPDGTVESAGIFGFTLNATWENGMTVDSTTIPFLTRRMWQQIGMIPIHYCTDVWVSQIGLRRGWPTRVCGEMRFTHYTAPAGRNYGRADGDTAEYQRRIAGWQP